MNTTRRRLAVAALACLAAADPEVTDGAPYVRIGRTEACSTDPSAVRIAGPPRIRPADARLAGVLLNGLRRSETFRTLIDALETRDVVAYVSLQPATTGRIGSVQWIASAGGLRYLNASVGVTPSRDALIAAMGHELEHVLEVAEDPSVTDRASFHALYRAIGEREHATLEIWETQRAYAVGERIGRELASSVALARQEIRLTEPIDWLAFYRCNEAGWSRQ
jgi:hypothetical protein